MAVNVSLQSVPPAGLHANVRWCHVHRSLIDTGDLAKMDGATVKVYLVLKLHTDLHDGVSNVGVETIAKEAGMSRMQVWRALRQLARMGYVSIGVEGRHHVYQMREQIPLADATDTVVGTATWPYQPARVREAVADLKQALDSQDLTRTSLVHIELSTPPEEPTALPGACPPCAADDQEAVRPLASEDRPPDAGAQPPGEHAALQTIKDPELRAQLAHLGALIMAAERPGPATCNTHVTYGDHQGYVTSTLPMPGGYVTSTLRIPAG